MARPKKCRRVCFMPDAIEFSPAKNYEETITMTIDEFEALRLLDYEGLFQEQCALQMNVSRATITSIYDNARKKIADALVNGKRLIIEGGDISLCENSNQCCGKCSDNRCGTCKSSTCKKSKGIIDI